MANTALSGINPFGEQPAFFGGIQIVNNAINDGFVIIQGGLAIQPSVFGGAGAIDFTYEGYDGIGNLYNNGLLINPVEIASGVLLNGVSFSTTYLKAGGVLTGTLQFANGVLVSGT